MANSNSSEDRLDKWLEELYTSADEAAADFVNDFPELRCEVQSLITAERERLLDAIETEAPKDCPTSGFGARSHSKTMNNINAAWRAVLAKYRKGK
jgi:hypothetical protein